MCYTFIYNFLLIWRHKNNWWTKIVISHLQSRTYLISLFGHVWNMYDSLVLLNLMDVYLWIPVVLSIHVCGTIQHYRCPSIHSIESMLYHTCIFPSRGYMIVFQIQNKWMTSSRLLIWNVLPFIKTENTLT